MSNLLKIKIPSKYKIKFIITISIIALNYFSFLLIKLKINPCISIKNIKNRNKSLEIFIFNTFGPKYAIMHIINAYNSLLILSIFSSFVMYTIYYN